MLAAGIAEGLLLAHIVTHPAWRAALPLALATIGVVFVLHAQHGSGAEAMLMMVQHRAFALTLLVSAAAKALAEMPLPRLQILQTAWLVPLVVFGLLLLTYSEPTTVGGAAASGHSMH